MSSPVFPPARAGLLVFSLLAVLALVGCSRTRERTTVQGTVTIGGKHLTAGTVMFYAYDNATASAPIDKDGRYVMRDAPVGDVKIAVIVPRVPPGMAQMMNKMKKNPSLKDVKSTDPEGSGKSIPMMGMMPTNIVQIPAKYADPNSSGLTYKVASGEQSYDIPLTP